jgi:hypothetical protein
MIEERVQRIATGALFAAGLALSELSWRPALAQRLFAAGLGLGTAALLAWVWGERTRPKNSLLWYVAGVAAVGLGALGGGGFAFPYALGLLVGLFLVHDMRLTPSLMLAAGLGAALWQPTKRWPSATESDAWWVALTMLFTLAAAVVERDRLARRQGPPVPPAWTAIRLGFLTIWTVGVVSAKKELQVGRLFAYFGADPTGMGGKILLLGIVVACLVAAGLLFRTKAPRQPSAAPPR